MKSNNPELRHHDLSNVGRAVSAWLGIRGDPQALVLKSYADVQTGVLKFLEANQHRDDAALVQWLTSLSRTSQYAVSTRPSIEHASALYHVLNVIESWTPDRLREAHQRDPEAELFSEDALLQLLNVARSRNIHQASDLIPFTTEMQPGSVQILERVSAIAESASNIDAVRDLTNRCLAVKIDDNDWRAQAAQQDCRERRRQLEK